VGIHNGGDQKSALPTWEETYYFPTGYTKFDTKIEELILRPEPINYRTTWPVFMLYG